MLGFDKRKEISPREKRREVNGAKGNIVNLKSHDMMNNTFYKLEG